MTEPARLIAIRAQDARYRSRYERIIDDTDGSQFGRVSNAGQAAADRAYLVWLLDEVASRPEGARILDDVAAGDLYGPRARGPAPKQPKASALGSCNLHGDCEAADAGAREAGRLGASHCYDDCCEDCFGS